MPGWAAALLFCCHLASSTPNMFLQCLDGGAACAQRPLGQCCMVWNGAANRVCTVLPEQEGLWWLPLRRRQQEALRTLLLVTALAGALAGLEGRLIWRAFGQYISAAVPSPWSYLIVTAALYGAAALFLLHYAGAPHVSWTLKSKPFL